VAHSTEPASGAIRWGVGSEASSALEQVNDQDDNGNHEQEMNQSAAC
jgi:hypothetical protein